MCRWGNCQQLLQLLSTRLVSHQTRHDEGICFHLLRYSQIPAHGTVLLDKHSNHFKLFHPRLLKRSTVWEQLWQYNLSKYGFLYCMWYMASNHLRWKRENTRKSVIDLSSLERGSIMLECCTLQSFLYYISNAVTSCARNIYNSRHQHSPPQRWWHSNTHSNNE